MTRPAERSGVEPGTSANHSCGVRKVNGVASVCPKTW